MKILEQENEPLSKLRDIAKSLGIPNFNRMKKESLAMMIREAEAQKEGIELRGGILEIMSEGIGFLRATNYRAAPGGRSARYDVLRAASPSGFGSAACVATNVAGTSSVDDTTPAPGVALHYLVRSENACGGNLGADSGGTPRSGAPCP